MIFCILGRSERHAHETAVLHLANPALSQLRGNRGEGHGFSAAGLGRGRRVLAKQTPAGQAHILIADELLDPRTIGVERQPRLLVNEYLVSIGNILRCIVDDQGAKRFRRRIYAVTQPFDLRLVDGGCTGRTQHHGRQRRTRQSESRATSGRKRLRDRNLSFHDRRLPRVFVGERPKPPMKGYRIQTVVNANSVQSQLQREYSRANTIAVVVGKYSEAQHSVLFPGRTSGAT